jgi:hypothetical protein
MIVRTKKESLNEQEKQEIYKKSLEYAKKAINLDIKDSESWCKGIFYIRFLWKCLFS